MHRTELNRMIAKLTGTSSHMVDRIGVNLGKGGLIQLGGRGRHAQDMEPEDLKNIIMALMGSDRTSKVFETVLGLHALRSKEGELFGDVMLDLCSNPDKAAQVMMISVLRNSHKATVFWKDETGSRVKRMQDFTGVDDRTPGMRIVASLSGSALEELAKLVQDEKN